MRSSDGGEAAMSTTSMPTPTIMRRPRSDPRAGGHSTVTDLARLRGWSTSWPISGGQLAGEQLQRDRRHERLEQRRDDGQRGSSRRRTARRRSSPSSASTIVRAPRARISWIALIILSCSWSRPRGRDDAEDRQALLDQRDRAVLELAGGEALGVDVGELLELQRALERHREAGVPAEEQHRLARPTSVSRQRRRPSSASSSIALHVGRACLASSSTTAAISSPYLVPRTWAR